MEMETEEYEELEDLPFADGGPTLGDVIFGTAAAGEEIKGEDEDSHEVPFVTVHDAVVPFKHMSRRVFIPNTPISVRISNYERNVTKHLLNPYLYTIELHHGPFSWTIYKRYKHFLYLHQQLKIFRASLFIPFPTETHRKNRQSFMEAKDNPKRTNFPRFPKKPEIMVGYDEVEVRAQELEQYLQNLLNIQFYRTHYETVLFLGASHLSFVSNLGIKSVEGMVKKQTGSTQRGCCCGLLECASCLRLGHVMSDLCGCWRERWLIVKDTWLGYVRPRDSMLRGVILFDHGFEISASLYSSAIQVYNNQRRVVFKCRGRRKRTEWCQTIKNVASRQGFGFTQRNVNSSFAPVRSDSLASWFVDGSSYMSAVADAIMRAKEEIFIADWWLSPEIYLKRPSLYGHEWRLDSVLERKAAEGVKIFVLLYKEVEMALGINSYYSKTQLGKCHSKNIKVLRHPDHAHSGVFLWAHHEKIVCVDQTYAFLGGIDLCYGRWDDHEHRLVDFGGYLPSGENPHRRKITSSRPLGHGVRSVATLVQKSNSIGLSTVTFPSNDTIEQPDLKDNGEVVEDHFEVIDLAETDAEPVQPSAENVKGDSPEFQRKSIFRKLQDSVQVSSKSLLMKITGEEPEPEPEPEAEVELKKEKVAPLENVNVVTDEEDGLKSSVKFWLGKDYCNFIVKDFCDLDSPYQDLVDRHTTPRMPWHDVGVMVHGAPARDVARHFIQRWNATKLEKAKKVSCYPYLVPKSYETFEEALPTGDGIQFRVNCQILRSVSSWSAGFQDPDVWEESIHEAYITTISKAQHYVYLENQFFISLARQNPFVKNQVGEALCKRILRAFREEKKFRVYIVLPLLPGFEGEVGGASGTALHAITHWNYASMCRGPDSLLTRLKEQGVDRPQDFISFHGLRNHSELHSEPITELIYVHSKLMIVDDTIVICGSANINDRSLIGRRDSEIAVIIKDENLVDGVMNGVETPVGQYASSLRKQLFSEHLGLLQPGAASRVDISDPISDEFFHDVWVATSAANTEIFEQVFHCLPSNQITTFKDLQSYHDEIPLLTSDPSAAAAKIAQIRGHLVDMPLEFLKDETLTPNPKSVEGMMPTALWT